MAPAIGVPKTDANPALMPHMTSFWRSLLLKRKMEANIEESPAPIWAAGPSFPAEPPAAMVIMVVASFTGTVMAFILLLRWWIASMTFSVPCPLASGARYLMRREERKRATGNIRK
ncbi:hypothetical protein BMS3Abin09_00629 [bacterium BMS3Abin09]|nr:hypothetical protein BMS3Abin09_00629 [bacterium BMS3Abin09]